MHGHTVTTVSLVILSCEPLKKTRVNCSIPTVFTWKCQEIFKHTELQNSSEWWQSELVSSTPYCQAVRVMLVWKLKRKGSCSSSTGTCDENWQADYRCGIWGLSSALSDGGRPIHPWCRWWFVQISVLSDGLRCTGWHWQRQENPKDMNLNFKIKHSRFFLYRELF